MDKLLLQAEETLKKQKPFSEVFPRQKEFFTIDALPDGWLKDYVNFAEPLTEAPIQYHIATALSIAATVLERKIWLSEGATNYYPNLYILVVGESGITRKSTALSMVYKFLPKINSEYLLGSIMSLEALYDSFREQSTHLILYDELKSLLVNEEKSCGRGLITFFTSVWLGPTSYRVDFKNIKPEDRIIKEPTLNVLAASTPDWLQLKEADVLGGFLGRFLPIYSANGVKRLAIRPAIDEIDQNVLIENLKRVGQVQGMYVWDEDAQETFKGLYDELHEGFDNEPNKAHIQPYWSRIDTHVRKLAMIFDACSTVPTFRITNANLVRAYGIMEIITDYYREMLGRITFGWTERKEKQLLELVEAAGTKGIDRSDAMRALHTDSQTFNKLAATLEEKDLIMVKEVKTSTRPKRVYIARKYDLA